MNIVYIQYMTRVLNYNLYKKVVPIERNSANSLLKRIIEQVHLNFNELSY